MRRLAPLLCSVSAAIAVLGGTAASAGAATASATCIPATTQPFASTGDMNAYFAVPGGTFEAGSPMWTLAGGAALVAGNNTAGGDPLANTTSLSLPTGSSATSPTACVTLTAPTMRFYVRNTGSAKSKLGVYVLFTLPNGRPGSLQVAEVTGTSVWQPSPTIFFYANLLTLVSPTGTTNVAFQFRPLDASGQWRIDDVYVDPFKHR